ncbi:hypothetical protein [Lactobacillus plantarum subsp. plantarum] [Lactiplantibacillus mudanjiangensis]|uniref:YhgE/Pip family protein n=1 Tax=Lactiplantibacillus mudanjiangensis TaxID=1296538 RepID=UPI0010144778|nr:YhgE/Pip family protein [Lactiplantibacillus mudanjiangensis]VDG19730.1 hypothetical protein [Lactobacillus plantarum subsp. plantarum] [Lactiplantibacillus mudanjiangensis]VDG31161.1 hypothetical protein [Lactobacillus plantarum subsp. plantarum] [Lactiplantibacillus mudanjiangensis]
MIKREWQQLGHKPGLIVVLIAIGLIPAIYCWLYLSSMWNTYGRMDEIPVAIVNHDVSQRTHGKTIAIGHHLVQSLKASDSLDYHEVSATKARQGLHSGRYYMIVTIPHNFSKAATTLLTKHPEQLQLHYRISSGRNFIVAKMTTGAASAIKDKVSQQVTKLYAGTLLTTIHQVDQGMQTAGNGASKLAAGTSQLQTGLTKITAGQTRVGTGLTTIQTKLPTLPALAPVKVGLGQLQNATTQLTAGSQTVQTGATQLQTGTQTLASKLDQSAQRLSKLPNKTINATYLAQPVKATVTDEAKVPNNGTGMSPFAIAIGLFVGGIALGTMFDAFTPAERPRHTLSWWAAKFSIVGLVGIGQAGLLSWTLKMSVGLKVQSMSQLVLLNMLGALTFLSIIFALRIILGGFGTWLVTIILVLQLSASSGLYPVQLTSRFASWLNPYLPMTYLIDGLRHAISLGGSINGDVWTLIGITIGMQLLVLGKFWLSIKTNKFDFLDGADLEKTEAAK